MPITVPMTVMFRVAAGPRVGFGHLVRCRSLARALGVEPRVSIRGTARTRRTARNMGWLVVPEAFVVAGKPALLVVDDPNAAAARVWVRKGRHRGIPVASIHDAGRAWVDSDLLIDGSIGSALAGAHAGRIVGLRFAMLDPTVHAQRRRPCPRVPARLVIALGGGAHVFSLIGALVRAIARRVPDAELRVARGFTARRLPHLAAATWVHAPEGLAAELGRADAAIVAGGLTLYEACALGTPAMAVAVAPGQRHTVRAAAACGAVVDAGGPDFSPRAIAWIADRAARLLGDPLARRRLSARARRMVDARGVWRVASALRRLAAAPRALDGQRVPRTGKPQPPVREVRRAA